MSGAKSSTEVSSGKVHRRAPASATRCSSPKISVPDNIRDEPLASKIQGGNSPIHVEQASPTTNRLVSSPSTRDRFQKNGRDHRDYVERLFLEVSPLYVEPKNRNGKLDHQHAGEGTNWQTRQSALCALEAKEPDVGYYDTIGDLFEQEFLASRAISHVAGDYVS